MKAYLKKFVIWKIVINPPILSNNKTKIVAQKNAKKDNTIALKFLVDELSSFVKENIGEYSSDKDLRFKLESEYQRGSKDIKTKTEVKPTEDMKQEEKEVQASTINEGKDHSDCCSFDSDDIENDLVDVKKDCLTHLLVDIDLKYIEA